MTQTVDTQTDTIRLEHAYLKRDDRTLWSDLELSVKAGEFIAILGPNGAGKTSLLKILLGILPLTKGDVTVLDKPIHRGNNHIGYIPQQKSFTADIPIRGRDLVRLGITGFNYGLSRANPEVETRIDDVIKMVGATAYADMPLGLLSGGEQQRLRVAQALVGQPDILLCDEPLLSLDISSQRAVTKLIDDYRQSQHASVLFVTHEVNPVLQYVDRILYVANGRWVIDTPEVVLRSETLSQLYGADIEVMKIKDRFIVLDAGDTNIAHHGDIQ